MMRPSFTHDDADRAHAEWHCNCGPTAFAAITGHTLDEARQAMPDFEDRRYVNPTMMLDALRRVSVGFDLRQRGRDGEVIDFPAYGLARIQWEGPWTAPDVNNKRRAYGKTHWVGVERGHTGIGIFDVNCFGRGSNSGWMALENWERVIVPVILAAIPRASGKWHITHAVQLKVSPAELRMAG